MREETIILVIARSVSDEAIYKSHSANVDCFARTKSAARNAMLFLQIPKTSGVLNDKKACHAEFKTSRKLRGQKTTISASFFQKTRNVLQAAA